MALTALDKVKNMPKINPKVEVLLDAIGDSNGAFDPDCDAYKLRNPLLIKSYAVPGKHVTDENGRRVFESLLSGYRAGIFDLDIKLKGESRSKLKTTDRLENLLAVYGIKEIGGVKKVVSFLRRALKDQTISKDTELSYFSDAQSSIEVK